MDSLASQLSLVPRIPNSPVFIVARTVNNIVIEAPDQSLLHTTGSAGSWQRWVPSRSTLGLAFCGNLIGLSLTKLDSSDVPLNRLIACGSIILGSLFTSVILIKWSCDQLDSCKSRCAEGSRLFAITTSAALLAYCGFR